MQKFILTLILIFTIIIPKGFSQNRSIKFVEKPWKELIAMAKQDNKMIFLDAFASWCGPCKWMAANMFTNDTVADYYNKTFICASIERIWNGIKPNQRPRNSLILLTTTLINIILMILKC